MKNLEKLNVVLNQKPYEVFITRKKIKNTYIRIDEQFHIQVSTNSYTSIESIMDLIYKNENKIISYIIKKQNKLLKEDECAYLGSIYKIKWIVNSSFHYLIEPDKVILYIPDLSKKVLYQERFYQEEANKILPPLFLECLKRFQEAHDIKDVSCFIRKMKSRYGTCYYKKNKVILNSFLVKYDHEAIKSVIFHELCHFIVHNHSKAFYNLLNQYVNNPKKIRQLLNKY